MIAGIPTEVLLAPDSFKGTFTAAEVAAAVARGLRAAGRETAELPVADGGEGTLEALSAALGLEPAHARVHDPLGGTIEARFGLGDGVALVEVAAASGLPLVDPARRDPVAATTRGTGELIAAALERGAHTVYVAAGGSATVDGGVGAIDAIAEAGGLRAARITVLCDVRTPFEHAAEVYGPQKGATPEQVSELTARLGRLARTLPRDPRGIALTGAAGGLAGGLWAALGAELAPGAAFVLDANGFDARMRAARAVITGEGRLDRQSMVGKVVGEVATRSRQAGVPCSAVVGRNALDRFDQRILDLEMVLEASTLAELEGAGARLALHL